VLPEIEKMLKHHRSPTILDAIGKTPLVTLRRVVPAGCARIVAMVESANPTGSMKDRMARVVIERAIADGRLERGGTVVDYTAGTTGVSLAFVAAALGYKCHFAFSDAFSDEKRRTMIAYGAEVTDVRCEQKRITRALIESMIDKAREIAAQPGHWWCDQLNNRDGQCGYVPIGDEMWHQTGERLDAFVHMVGSAHSIHGVATGLRQYNPDLHVVAVEPSESPVLAGNVAGPHRIEGVGIGFLPPLWNPAEVNEIQSVSTEEANDMVRRLAKEDALFVGTSTGANVIVAIRMAQRLGPAATVGTLIIDSGLRYLSAGVFGRSD
jgi:cysteine synthase A